MGRLDRLLRPNSIAVIGGGIWGTYVVDACRRIGYAGAIWPVHPTKAEVGGLPAFARVGALPEAPDAAFVGVNRAATIEVMAELAAKGAGGAVAFASGFREADAEVGDGSAMQEALIAAAGEMPFLGPNCYGILNALDGAAIWPDQHGLVRVDRGVAVITQSSNIANNITMQRRGLPLAYVVTAGNQAQTSMAELGAAILADPRVTALGLYVEGFGDVRGFEALARAARAAGKGIVAVKAGASEQSRAATVSHTAALAGSDAGAEAFLRRLGIGRVDSPSALLEALKILHVAGPLKSNKIASISCSGGEASLMADGALGRDLVYPRLNERQATDLRAALGPKVALANPLDYHTYIWGDEPSLTACFSGMVDPDLALSAIVLDFPREDRCTMPEWEKVVNAAETTARVSGAPVAILSSLADNMPEARAAALIDRGLIPLAGISDALEAIEAAAAVGRGTDAAPVLVPHAVAVGRTLDEAEAKAVLAGHGLDVPRRSEAGSEAEAASVAETLGFPVVLKGTGAAHKTEAGLVKLHLRDGAAVRAAAGAMPSDSFLVEEMVTGGVAELIVGVVCDPAHGFVLTLGAGGTLTEILGDTVSLLVPASRDEVDAALETLKIAPLLKGYRGAAPANRAAILDAVMAVQAAVEAMADRLIEIEINPLIATPERAVAADALIRLGETI